MVIDTTRTVEIASSPGKLLGLALLGAVMTALPRPRTDHDMLWRQLTSHRRQLFSVH